MSRRSGGTWHDAVGSQVPRPAIPAPLICRLCYPRAMAPVLPSLSLAAPALIATARGALWRAVDGSIERLKAAEAVARAKSSLPLVCHAPAVAARLGVEEIRARDLLELFAFVQPAIFCLPTPRGLCEALDLPLPATPEEEVASLPEIAHALLDALEDMAAFASAEFQDIARAMARGNWAWGDVVMAALGLTAPRQRKRPARAPGLDVWRSLPQWEEPPPAPPPGSLPVEPREARLRLAQLVSAGANLAEARPTQSDYASAASQAFAPREEEGKPNVALIEAGTGVGKTLGYVAPASLWAEKNGAPVWISTYTRNLQRQIDGELDRLHRDSAEKRRRVVIRKGRENYLCLLNFQEAVQRTRARAGECRRPRPAGALGAGQPRRRHDRRRSAGLAARPGRPQPRRPPRRPARRVHLFGLRALPQMLRRAHHPPRPPGRHRDRQPCAGHDPGGDGRARRRHAADALCLRRGPSSVRRRRRRLRRASERRRGLRSAALASGRRGTARQPRPRPGTPRERSSRRGRGRAEGSRQPARCHPHPAHRRTGRRAWPTAP